MEPVLYFPFTVSKIGKFFLQHAFLFYLDILKFTLITFLRLPAQSRKIYNRAMCFSKMGHMLKMVEMP